MTLRRHLCLVLAGVVGWTAFLVFTATPSSAVHQNCGTNYPAGSLSNGHPDLAADADIGWAGQTALNTNEAALFAATAVKEALLDGAGVAGSVAEVIHQRQIDALKALDNAEEKVADVAISSAERVARVVALALVVGGLVTLVVETALMFAQRALAGAVGGENACNAVLAGDMLDQSWVATVERNLASDGPPLALLLTPTDSEEAGGNSGEWPLQPQHEKGDFEWCPPIDLPDELPPPAGSTNTDEPNGASLGDDCTPSVHDGFLTHPYDDAPRVTVEAIVRDAIDHAKAHGLDVRDAETYYSEATTAVGQGRFKEAFQHFRLAYQNATGFDGAWR